MAFAGESRATNEVHSAITRLTARKEVEQIDLDASQPLDPEQFKAAIARARLICVRVYGGRFALADDLASWLQRCYEMVRIVATSECLPMTDVDVIPCFNAVSSAGHLPLCDLDGPRFDYVVVGGTFDHLHAGHKVLLTVAAALATRKLVVGVSGPPLLEGKQGAAILEPWKARAHRVADFVTRVRPDLPTSCEELLDGFGPSLWPEMRCLVVSAETKSGGSAVNLRRRQLGLPEVGLVVIPLVSAASGYDKESSTEIRQRLDGLEALSAFWSVHVAALGVTEHHAAMRWGAILQELAGSPPADGPVLRRPPLERVRRELRAGIASVATATSGMATLRDSRLPASVPAVPLASIGSSSQRGSVLAAGLALCIAAVRLPARSTQIAAATQRATLLIMLARDLRLGDDVVGEALTLLEEAARPRILGVVNAMSVNDDLGAQRVVMVQELLETWGAAVIVLGDVGSPAGDVGTRAAALLERSPLVVVTDGSSLSTFPMGGQCAPEWTASCDEVWSVTDVAGPPPDPPSGIDAVVCLDSSAARGIAWSVPAVASVRQLCEDRGLGGLPGLRGSEVEAVMARL